MTMTSSEHGDEHAQQPGRHSLRRRLPSEQSFQPSFTVDVLDALIAWRSPGGKRRLHAG
jgi:hypothetical protein